MLDLRKALYREKEETLDNLDALTVYASFNGYSVEDGENSKCKLFILFNKDPDKIYLYINEDSIRIVTNINFYMDRIHGKIEDISSSTMRLDRAIEIMMKIL
ncbi:hypothetical protein D3C87_81150 [compost metagenome]